MSEPMVQVPKSWLTNREKVRRNRDSWKRQAQEWEAIARVLAGRLAHAGVLEYEDRFSTTVSFTREVDGWLTWAREQVSEVGE